MLDDAEAARARADDPDAAQTYEGWEDTVTLSLPETKKQITLRVDAEVLGWYRSHGKGYQTLMNAVLKGYMEQKVHRD
ncbi:hypothetical protein DXV76_20970 [Rhodobacteraceae bacterium CCMM004]|nr:hypothetical protein DXV76_20970 [Rhodobacteraceae bacterium CCMM004]